MISDDHAYCGKECVKPSFGTSVQFFMSMLPTLLRSLLLTSFLSFHTPIILLTGVLAAISAIGYVPGFETISQAGAAELLKFLAVFGSGCPFEGVIVIGLTCSLVGALFDTYAFYSYQHLNNH